MAKKTKTPDAAAAAGGQQAPPPDFDWSKATVTGFENTRQEDLGIPFLAIVQKGSPEVDRTHKDYATKKIADAEVGDIFNTITREVLFTDGEPPVRFVPCQHQRMFVEWKPRGEGGGFVKQHDNPAILRECRRDEDGRDVIAHGPGSGNIIVTTSYFAGFLLRDGQKPERVIISLTSTQLKKARLWLNMAMTNKLNGNVLPFYSREYHLSTTPEQNAEGSWFGWKIESGNMVRDGVLIASCMDVARQTIAGPTQAALPAPSGEDDKVM